MKINNANNGHEHQIAYGCDGFTIMETLCAFLILSLTSIVMIQTIQTGVRGTLFASQKAAAGEFVSKMNSHDWEIDNPTQTDPTDWSLASSHSFIGSRRTKIIKIDAKLIERVENYKFLTYRKILD